MGDLTMERGGVARGFLPRRLSYWPAWRKTAWVRHAVSRRRFAQPIDAGATFRGRARAGRTQDAARLRGDGGRPAAASFAALAAAIGDPARARGLWPLPPAGYAWLGGLRRFRLHGRGAAQFTRQAAARRPALASVPFIPRPAALQFSLRSVSTSGLGMLLAVSAIVATPAMTWLLVLLIGPSIHWAFQRPDVSPGG